MEPPPIVAYSSNSASPSPEGLEAVLQHEHILLDGIHVDEQTAEVAMRVGGKQLQARHRDDAESLPAELHRVGL